MQITIKRNVQQELECYKIKIDLLMKPVRLATILLIVGIALIIICRSDAGVTDTSISVYVFFEFLCFIFSYSLFKTAYKNRKVYKETLKSAIKDYGTFETYSTITIDDKYFIYESLKSFYKLSWTSLNMYQFYKGNLVLMIDGYKSSFIIRPNELTSSEFNTLAFEAAKKLKLRTK